MFKFPTDVLKNDSYRKNANTFVAYAPAVNAPVTIQDPVPVNDMNNQLANRIQPDQLQQNQMSGINNEMMMKKTKVKGKKF
ncbi:hypothetical protein PIROE2DRAFT_16836 [Piromyces sp. E2]|nr:hypothetical protein PIROE2DRAFT_16836 [Piromyces sp. E2]|eukprot:OUM58006.1 hypothetical protein PIROE2DRAFT_16836 [Piromyces sp. E2]